MGKNTYFSLPENCRPLKERYNFVLSTTLMQSKYDNIIICKTWEDIKMVLLVMGIAIAAISVVAASIYYANMGQ